MKSTDNIVRIDAFKQSSEQDIIDDIGARAFLFLRDEAEEKGVPVKEVIVEHMLGMALVVEAVDGTDEATILLELISKRLGQN